jgi:hypothetical protein
MSLGIHRANSDCGYANANIVATRLIRAAEMRHFRLTQWTCSPPFKRYWPANRVRETKEHPHNRLCPCREPAQETSVICGWFTGWFGTANLMEMGHSLSEPS